MQILKHGDRGWNDNVLTVRDAGDAEDGYAGRVQLCIHNRSDNPGEDGETIIMHYDELFAVVAAVQAARDTHRSAATGAGKGGAARRAADRVEQSA